MTTIAMVAGMLPSALAFGIGGEFRSPMALAVIGGLIFSTLLSLVFVPAVFVMISEIQERSMRGLRWLIGLSARRKAGKAAGTAGPGLAPQGLGSAGPAE
jgi:hypothetical protein